MNLIAYLRAINSSELFEIIYLTLQIIINIIVILKLEKFKYFWENIIGNKYIENDLKYYFMSFEKYPYI